MVARLDPEGTDVLVRQKPSNNATPAYLVGTYSAPDQFIVPTRDGAVSQALAFAKRQHVRAWFASSDDEFILLGTFRQEIVEPARSS